MSTGPTLAGFNTFVYGVMRIDPLILPSSDPLIGYAYNVATAIANPDLAFVPCDPGAQWDVYAMALYNLGGSNIVNYAQDQPGRTYFTDMRKAYGVKEFVPGVVSSTSDQATSSSYLNQDFMKTLTLSNLQALKDPWGRQYLMFAQASGPIWGLT